MQGSSIAGGPFVINMRDRDGMEPDSGVKTDIAAGALSVANRASMQILLLVQPAAARACRNTWSDV